MNIKKSITKKVIVILSRNEYKISVLDDFKYSNIIIVYILLDKIKSVKINMKWPIFVFIIINCVTISMKEDEYENIKSEIWRYFYL